MAMHVETPCTGAHAASQVLGHNLRVVAPFKQTHRRLSLKKLNNARQFVIVSASAAATEPHVEDKWVASTLAACGTSENAALAVAPLRSAAQTTLSTLRMPTTRVEEYKYLDITPILQSTLVKPAPVDDATIAAAVAQHQLKAPAAATIVLVDGVRHEKYSSINSLPDGVYVGSLQGAPKDIISFALGAQTRGRGGPFATLNGALVQDVTVIHVPANKSVLGPIHILNLSSASSQSASMTLSAPRILAVLEEGAVAEVIEEYAPLTTTNTAAGSYLCSSVAEFELDDGALLKHSYVELEAPAAAHMKTTLVNQGKESTYTLTEARIGGRITRHDLSIDQLGDATSTVMSSFILAGQQQVHDLHSKLKLDHPNGEAKQVHKCIVADATGRGVFDGNVKVNRLAQKTDAQQLSRNLLLVPKATVNVKPNLQIIADDVKCTHGCAISDLEDEELFYLRARGIDAAAARQMLVYSFGREVVNNLRDQKLMDRVGDAVKETLKNAPMSWTAEDEA